MTRPLIDLGDRETALDLAAFLRRARAISDDGARLTLTGSSSSARLDVSVPVLVSGGLLDSGPEILAVRSWAVPGASPGADRGPTVDAVYDHASLLDRLERGGGVQWPVPPAEIHRAWAGQSIPRDSWRPAGFLATRALVEADQEGSRAIAESLPDDPGQAMVNQARRAVWGEPADRLGGLPAGVGFAAVKLGFLGGPARRPETVPVRQREGHVLLSLPFGVLVVRGGAVRIS